MLNIIKRDKKIIIASIIIGLVFTFSYCIYRSAVYAEAMQRELADEVIRLHVLANSDSESDQELKLLVRDGVLELMCGFLDGTENKETVREILTNHLDEIETRAVEIIAENGEEFAVYAYLTLDKFPTKQYGNVTFPAGVYEALRIEIGEGKGRNWWCIMFPPLCFVDITQGNLNDADLDGLKNVMTAEQYEIITKSPESKLDIKVKFKIIELWQKLWN